ncbi:MAG: methylmalonyl-CoA carboxyltransferase, partial [Chloroflexus aggregans]
METHEEQLATLHRLRERAMQGGGAERIAQQHAHGKLTAHERLALLLDPGSFQEIGALATSITEDDEQRIPGDGTITGFGKINGRRG